MNGRSSMCKTTGLTCARYMRVMSVLLLCIMLLLVVYIVKSFNHLISYFLSSGVEALALVADKSSLVKL